MKLFGYRKYILTLIFLANANILYFLSDKYNKLELMFDFLIFLSGIAIAGSIGSKFANKINKDEP